MRIAAALASALGSRSEPAPRSPSRPRPRSRTSRPRWSSCARAAASRGSRSGTSTAAPKKAETKRFEVGKVVLVDVKSKKKHFPIKDANGQFVGGPIGDSIDGGRIFVTLPPGQPGVLWTYFDALPAGTVVSVEVPQMFPFEDVVVTEGAGTLLSATEAKSTPVDARWPRWSRPNAPTRR